MHRDNGLRRSENYRATQGKSCQSKNGAATAAITGGQYIYYWGMMNFPVGTNFQVSGHSWSGIYLAYEPGISGNWQACAASSTNFSTGVTRVDTGVAVAIDVWLKCMIVTNADWSTISYYISGTLVANISSGHLPTAATDEALNPNWFLGRTGTGTSSSGVFACMANSYIKYLANFS